MRSVWARADSAVAAIIPINIAKFFIFLLPLFVLVVFTRNLRARTEHTPSRQIGTMPQLVACMRQKKGSSRCPEMYNRFWVLPTDHCNAIDRDSILVRANHL